MKLTLVYDEEHHKLAVHGEEMLWSEPKLQEWWWEIWTGSRSNAELYALGHELKDRFGHATGDYVYAYDPVLPPGAARVVFQVVGGANCQAYRMKATDVPPPRVRAGVELRWERGAWEKYLKAKGWVRA